MDTNTNMNNTNITLEQVEKLREKANVSYEDAKHALEVTGGDLLEAVIYLEHHGKINTPHPESGFYSTKGQQAGMAGGLVKINVQGENSESGGDSFYEQDSKSGSSTLGDQLKKLWNAFIKLIHRGNINHFEVHRNNKCIMSIPVTLLILALLFFFWVTLPALIIGLFFGCKYRFRGPDLGKDAINKAMNAASETAEEIKRSVEVIRPVSPEKQDDEQCGEQDNQL